VVTMMPDASQHSAGDVPDPALHLEGIEAGYGANVVLHNIHLEVPSGKVVALLGPNGAGKSTLLRAAVGLVRPRSGRVRLAGEDVTKTSPNVRARKGLCLIPEGRGIFPNLTIAENIRLQLQRDTISVDEAFDKIRDVFPVICERRNKAAGRLSGGQQQMLALCRAYITRPTVVLLDEVSMGLAPRAVDEIFSAIRQLVDTGTAILIVEQYVNRALDVADRAVLLSKGTVLFNGRSDDLDEDAVLLSYLGADLTDDSAGHGDS
jgi:branched-chain amino acid transport system ATP-binding protein